MRVSPGLLLIVGWVLLLGVPAWMVWRERREDAAYDARRRRDCRRENIARLERELGFAPPLPPDVIEAEFDPDAVGYFYR